jgi:hypothetical protein
MRLDNWLETAKKTDRFVAIMQENITTLGNDAVITYVYWLASAKPGKVKRVRTTVLVRNLGRPNEDVFEEEL